MRDDTIQPDIDVKADFDGQATRARILEIMIEEDVSDNTAASFGLLPEYLEMKQKLKAQKLAVA